MTLETPAPAFAELLRGGRAEILADWESEARALPGAESSGGPVLQEHLPELLERIARSLEDRRAEDLLEPASAAALGETAKSRLDEGADPSQVIQELSVLRRCVLRRWAGRAPDELVSAADLLNQSIDRSITASVERYTHARDRTLLALDRISIAALESRDLHELLERLLRVVLETAPAVDTGMILLREGERFVARAAVGLEQDVVGRYSFAIGESIGGRAAAEKRPVFVPSGASDPTLRSEVLRGKNVKALYAIPLLEGDQVIGVAKMGSLTAYDFTSEDKRLFMALATRATSAITQHVLRALADAQTRELARERALIRNILMNAPAAVAVVRGPEHVYELSNPVNNLYLGQDPVGKRVRDVFPESESRRLVALLDEVLRTGRAYSGNEVRLASRGPDGTLRPIFVNFVYQPVYGEEGRPEGVAVFAYDVTPQVTARIQQEEVAKERARAAQLVLCSEERLRLITDTLPVLISYVGADLRYKFTNKAYETWLGRPQGSMEGKAVVEVVGEAAWAIFEPYARAALAGEPQRFETRIERLGMGPRDVEVSYLPHRGPHGTVEGFVALVTDVTERRASAEAIRQSRDQLRVILEGVSEGILAIDRHGHVLFANEEARRTSGFTTIDELRAASERPDGALPLEIRNEAGELLPRERAPLFEALTTGQPVQRILRTRPRGGGAETWWNVMATPVRDPSGSVVMVIAIWHDVTGRRLEEDRQRFLSDATAILAESLDLDETLRRIARLAVPSIADWCLVDLASEGRERRRIAIEHVDPEKVRLAKELQRRYPPDLKKDLGVTRVLRTGSPELHEEITDEMLARWAHDDEHLRILRDLAIGSVMIVPMTYRGRVIGSITLVRERTRHRFAEEDLALALELARRSAIAVENAALFAEAEAANRQKDAFLAMLAHELRNPLGPMMNAAALLQAGSKSKRPLEVLDRQVRHMSRLVDDLLEVSRISRGKIELRLERVDLAGIAREVSADRAASAREANLRLGLDVPAEPVWVHGDRTRLAQALTNVVTNAIKFTEPGGRIDVRVAIADRSAVVSVRDTGIGIDPSVLPKLFEPFTQADQTLDRSRGGLGLGLAIVRGLVELHGGSVSAHSEGRGKGTEVRLMLPRAEHAAAGARASPRESVAAPLRILIVEDNVDAAEMMQALLEFEGHVVAICDSGECALEDARTFRPDVILCDIGLPRKDGFAVARELKADPDVRHARLIAISGYGTDADKRRARESGFDEHLTKPVDPAHLSRLLAEIAASR